MRIHTRLARVAAGLGLGLAIAVAAPVIAEPAPGTPNTQLESVTTTARKQEETLIDVPVAVSALTANDLNRYKSRSLTEIADSIPQVQITPQTSGNGGSIVVRGITSASIDPGIEAAVSINVDGVQISRGYIAAAAFLDLQQVEVLKGPQALFFGKNSPAGVISLRSKLPGDTWEGYATAGYEFRAAEKYVEAAYGGPVNDKFGVRFAFRFDDMDGWLRNLSGPLANPFEPNHPYPGATNNLKTPARQDIIGRVTFDFKPTDNFHATLRVLGDVYKDNDLTGNQQIVQCPFGSAHPTTRGIVDPYDDCKRDRYRSVGGLPTAIRDNYPLAKDNKDFFTDRHSILVSLDMNYNFGSVNVDSVTGLYSLKTNGLGNYAYTTIDYFPGINGEKDTNWSQEVRVTSTYEGPVNFVLGGYFESAKRTSWTVGRGGILNTIPKDPAVNFDVGYWPNDTSDRTTWSGFGQVLWNIVDNLQLTGGVRYSSEHIDASNENTYTNPAFPKVLRAPGNPLTGTIDESNWSPEATLTWHPAPDQTLYAAYKTGYKSGGLSQTAILLASNTFQSLSFGPETARGGEIGYKAQLDDNRLRVSVDAYMYDFNGLQRSALDIPTTSFLTRNAAKAVTQGVEAEAVWQASEYLQLRVAATYNDAHYKDFSNAPCYNGQLIIEGPTSKCGAVRPGVVDLSGKPIALAPKVVASFGASYDIPVSDWLWVGFTSDVKVSSGYWAQDQEPNGSRQKSYAKLNASIRFHDPADKWEFAVIGRNLTNQMILLSTGDTPGGGPGQLTGTLDRGREIAVQATAHF